MSTTDRTPWAQRMADQNEKIAQRLYDDELQAVETFGPQPLDSETGEPQQRIAELEQIEMHAILRESNEGLVQMIMGETEKLGITPFWMPNGVFPKQMIKDMIADERRHQGGE